MIVRGQTIGAMMARYLGRRSFWRRVAAPTRCRRGVSALEFALAAPAFALAVAVLIELTMMMFVSALMEGGLREAARFGITGFSPDGMSREERIRDIVAENTIGLVDMTTATIDQKIYPAFADVGKPEPFEDLEPFNGAYDAGEPYQDVNGNGKWDADMGVSGAGGPGDVVLYTVEADWRPLTPVAAPLFGTGGRIRLKASVAVRNEPFDSVVPGGGAGP